MSHKLISIIILIVLYLSIMFSIVYKNKTREDLKNPKRLIITIILIVLFLINYIYLYFIIIGK